MSKQEPTLYDYLKQFHSVYETGILTDKAAVLYWQMVGMFNAYGWKKWVGVDTAQLMAMIHTTNKKTALRERDILIRAGLIDYKKGHRGKVSEYGLRYSHDTQSNPETGLGYSNDTYSDTHADTYYDTQNDTPHKKEDLRPKTKDVSNRKVSSTPKRTSYGSGCAETAPPSPAPSVPLVFQIPLNDNSLFPVTADMVAHWRELYPAVNIEQELRKMIGWCEANPRKRKTRGGVTRFINGWLSKEQNRGGGYRQGGSYAEGNGYRMPQESPYYSRGTKLNPDGTWDYDPGDTSGSL